MREIHNCTQGEEAWKQIRLGKLTGSNFHTLMGNGDTKETILWKKAAERLTGVASDQDSFKSIHTDRGHQLENDARIAYELETGLTITQVGFVQLGEFVGCSPDGLLINGGVEIKCKDNHGFLKAVIKNYIEPMHRTQMQFNMYVCDSGFWDYTLYNPNFQNPSFITRVYRDEEHITNIKKCIIECNKKIDKYVQEFNKRGTSELQTIN